MLRLAQRLPERVPPEASEWLESAQAAHWYKPGSDRRIAHSALAAARHRIDLGRRRPADWTRLSVLDWDADASDEVHVESPELSLVIDAEEGTVLYVDHKPSERSVSYLPGQAPWHLAQAMVGQEPKRITFALAGVEEARGRVGRDHDRPRRRGRPDRETKPDRTAISDNRTRPLAAAGPGGLLCLLGTRSVPTGRQRLADSLRARCV